LRPDGLPSPNYLRGRFPGVRESPYNPRIMQDEGVGLARISPTGGRRFSAYRVRGLICTFC
jgi:hypothetical protein